MEHSREPRRLAGLDAEGNDVLDLEVDRVADADAVAEPFLDDVDRRAFDTEQFADDGLRHSVRVGDAIDFEVEDIVPYGIETGRPVRFDGMFHPVGSDLTMAEARRSRINAFGIDYEGKTGLSTAEFAWSA
jgi:hypothetical protein